MYEIPAIFSMNVRPPSEVSRLANSRSCKQDSPDSSLPEASTMMWPLTFRVLRIKLMRVTIPENGVVALFPHFAVQKWGNRATTPFSSDHDVLGTTIT